ncbi:MAG: hypothetical protein IJ612_07510 [Prevotella sp.]|nr:hypothetical protein [Prevotella sp.]
MGKKTAEKPKKQPSTQAWLTEQRLRFYPLVLSVLALVLALVVITTREGDYLRRVEDLNLFLYTPLFLKDQLMVPGGLLTWMGTYFTQFFYTPWQGTLLLCLWCGLLLWLTRRAFALSVWWSALLVVPLALVLLTDFDLGYWIYILKLRGHFFITVIGASIAVATTWAYRCLPARWGLPTIFMVLMGVLLYPLAGFYGLLAVVLMAVTGWRTKGHTLAWRIADSAVAALLVVFVPLVCYRTLFCQTSTADLWTQALPLFATPEPYPQYYWPYRLLVALLLVLAATYGSRWSHRWVSRPVVWVPLQVVVVGTSLWACHHYWYKDANFYRELKMETAIEQQDWAGVLSVAASSTDEPTRTIWMYKNLALFRLGRIGNEMYNYRNGSAEPAAGFTVPLVVQGGKQLYLYYGLPNYCYRWCMEDGVEYGWRTMYLKYQARCALLNGETTLARKFADLLKKTRNHRELGEHYEQLALHPEQLASDPELGPVIPLMDHESLVASDQSVVETFLLMLLSNHAATNPQKSELAMAAALQQKDIPTFWRAFDGYVRTHPDGPMPRHYQEAAYLFGMLEKQVDVNSLPFDQSIIDSYNQFMQMAQQLAGSSEEQLARAMRPRFGHTYYYDYFLMRGLKTH